ncbi:MAG TPA: hypothetical protein VFG14_03905 [Chthoniobacteraceae bacterium]|nr:hypothetical protein [Chthoniobacteraceae bacterium]
MLRAAQNPALIFDPWSLNTVPFAPAFYIYGASNPIKSQNIRSAI